jgi:hypothetical protein
MGPLGSNGYQLHDTGVDDINAQGFWQQKLQGPQLENALQREGIQAETARRGQDADMAKFTLGTAAGQDTARMQDATQRNGQQLNFEAAKLPFDWQREKFRQVFPLFQSGAGNGFGNGQPGRAARRRGSNTPTPNVTVGGVYSPQQVDQSVNAALAKNAQQTATANRDVGQTAAARGMSSRSPLVAALMGRNTAAQLGADADASRQIRGDAAAANAKQQTTSEALREQAWQAENQLDVNRRQVTGSQQNALLAALAGIL